MLVAEPDLQLCPSIPGMRISRIKHAVPVAGPDCRKTSADSNTITWYPADLSRVLSESLIDSSSSITAIKVGTVAHPPVWDRVRADSDPEAPADI
jgi:hypothetical protein